MSAAPRHEARPGEALLAGDGAAAVLRLRGDWTLAHHAALRRQAEGLRGRLDAATRIETDELGMLDTAGARLLHSLLGGERIAALLAEEGALSRERRALLRAVVDAIEGGEARPVVAEGYALGTPAD